MSTVIEGIDDRNFIMVSRFPHNCAHDGRNIKTFLDGNKVRCHPGSNRIFIIGGQARQFLPCRLIQMRHPCFFLGTLGFLQEIDGFVRLHLGEDGSCPFSWQNLKKGFLVIDIFHQIGKIGSRQKTCQALPFGRT